MAQDLQEFRNLVANLVGIVDRFRAFAGPLDGGDSAVLHVLGVANAWLEDNHDVAARHLKLAAKARILRNHYAGAPSLLESTRDTATWAVIVEFCQAVNELDAAEGRESWGADELVARGVTS